MTALLVVAVAVVCFVFGALALGVLLWLWPSDGSSVAFERREDERRLQHLTHAAMAQMLAELRTGRPSNETWPQP